MKISALRKLSSVLMISTLLLVTNTSLLSAKEPIMQEKYTIEEQKVKRAQFIWTACIEELRKDNVLSDKDAQNIHKYLKESTTSNNSELPLKRCDKEKQALQVKSVDKLVQEKIITAEQGNLLRKKLNKYDLSNLEN